MLWILSGPDFEVMVISVPSIIFLEDAITIENLINFFFLSPQFYTGTRKTTTKVKNEEHQHYKLPAVEFIDILIQTNELLLLWETQKEENESDSHHRSKCTACGPALGKWWKTIQERWVTSLQLVLKCNIFLLLEVTRGAKYSRQDKMVCFFSSVMGCKMQTTDKLW